MGLHADTAEFDTAWRHAAYQYSVQFREAQRITIQRSYYDPSVKRILDNEKLDIRTRSPRLREFIFAWTAASGPGDRLVSMAAGELKAEGKWNFNDPNFDDNLISKMMGTISVTQPELWKKLKYFDQQFSSQAAQ